MSFTSLKPTKALGASFAALSLLLSSAFAADNEIEEVVVTGSLIKKDRFDEVESQLKSTNYIKTILKGIN